MSVTLWTHPALPVLRVALLNLYGEHADCDDLCTHRYLEREDAERAAFGVLQALGDAGFIVEPEGQS